MKLFKKNNYFVHESSYIDDNVSIGKGTNIWHFNHISSDVKIGERVNIGQNVYIAKGVLIGNGCKIQNNISLYEGLIVEDDVFIGPSVVFTNVINPRAFISRKKEFKKTILKKGCTIGANSTIISGITIGEYSFIGAGSVVTKDVKPYTIVYGNPVKEKGLICKCGNRFGNKFKSNDIINCDCMKGINE